MPDQVDFDINSSLKAYLSDPATIPTSEADSALLDCESDPDALTPQLVNRVLNAIVDAVAENPDAISSSNTLDSLQFLLKCAPTSLSCHQNYVHKPDSELLVRSRSTSLLSTNALSKILDLVMSGLAAEAEIIHTDFESDEQDAVQHHKRLLEIYGFLLQWSIAAVETKASETSAAASSASGRAGRKSTKSSKGAAKDAPWDPTAQLQTTLETMCKVLKLKISSIFLTTLERDTFVSLLTRPVYLMLENEQRVKTTTVRMHAFKVLCIAIKHHGHAFGWSKTDYAQVSTNWKTRRRPDVHHAESVIL